jgi:hypothetical protein
MRAPAPPSSSRKRAGLTQAQVDDAADRATLRRMVKRPDDERIPDEVIVARGEEHSEGDCPMGDKAAPVAAGPVFRAMRTRRHSGDARGTRAAGVS